MLFLDVSSSLGNPSKKSSTFGSQQAAIFVRVPSSPVRPCTTSGSGVLVRNTFPVPFELKFCQFDFDYSLNDRQFLISETTCFMMISFEVDVKLLNCHSNFWLFEFLRLKFKMFSKLFFKF